MGRKTVLMAALVLAAVCASAQPLVNKSEEMGPSLPQRASKWHCKAAAERLCTEDLCSSGPSSDSYELQFTENVQLLTLCKGARCTVHGARVSSDTLETRIDFGSDPPWRSEHPVRILTVQNDGSRFLLIETSASDVFMYFGTCRPG